MDRQRLLQSLLQSLLRRPRCNSSVTERVADPVTRVTPLSSANGNRHYCEPRWNRRCYRVCYGDGGVTAVLRSVLPILLHVLHRYRSANGNRHYCEPHWNRVCYRGCYGDGGVTAVLRSLLPIPLHVLHCFRSVRQRERSPRVGKPRSSAISSVDIAIMMSRS
jgi:hypothetical protein